MDGSWSREGEGRGQFLAFLVEKAGYLFIGIPDIATFSEDLLGCKWLNKFADSGPRKDLPPDFQITLLTRHLRKRQLSCTMPSARAILGS